MPVSSLHLQHFGPAAAEAAWLKMQDSVPSAAAKDLNPNPRKKDGNVPAAIPLMVRSARIAENKDPKTANGPAAAAAMYLKETSAPNAAAKNRINPT
jgi:hypothetical protein